MACWKRKLVLLIMIQTAFAFCAEMADLPASLDMNEAERLLYINNLTVIAARHGIDASRAARLIATYTPNPTLTIGSEQIKTDRHLKSYAAETGTASNPTYTMRIDQLIETGGKKRLRTEVANYTLMANEAQTLDAIRLQTQLMKQFYLVALLAKENMASAAIALESIHSTEQLMTKQLDRGNIAEADVIKFQTNTIQYERDVLASKLAYDQAVRDLINILGFKPNATVKGNGAAVPVLELQGTLAAPDIDFDVDALRLQAEDRSDVIAAKKTYEAADKNICLNLAMRSVDVTVGGEYQRVGGDNTVGVVVSVPLPLYNNHRGNIEQAEAQRNQSFSQYKQIKQQAQTDVDKSYQSLVTNRKIVQLYTADTLKKAKQSLDIVGKAYERKAASLLDVLDAQRTYRLTVQAANQAQFDYRTSIVNLEAAAGQRPIEPAK